MFKTKKQNKGFTLIEIIVSLAVFSTVVLIILGAVLAIINLQRKTNAFRVAQENLSYAFESMIKEMKTGSVYVNTGTSINRVDFINENNKRVFYELVGGQIKKCISTDKTYSTCLGGQYIPLTSPEITIEKLSFTITGADVEADKKQPMVRIILSGSVGRGTRYSSDFFLQTIVTQREIDS